MTPTEKIATIVDIERFKKDGEVNFREYFVDNRFAMTEEMFKGKAVLDIGANIGIFSLFAWAHGADPIFAVESNAANYDKLCENTMKATGLVPLHFAAFNGVVKEASVTEGGGVSKIAPTIQLGGETVACKSLAELLEFMPPWDDMVLKVDVEGAEYDILLYAAAKEIRRFKTVFLETHRVFPGGPSPLEPRQARTAAYIVEYMQFLGYEIAKKDAYLWFEWDANGNTVGCTELPDQHSYRLERK